MEQSHKLLESCFNVVPCDQPPPHQITTFTQASPPLVALMSVSGSYQVPSPPSLPKSLTHLSNRGVFHSDPPPLALTQAYCSLSAAWAEQWLLIGGWDGEGSLGSIYRDSLIYQNNNNPPPQRERGREREANWLLVSHLRGNVHTRTHFVLLKKRGCPFMLMLRCDYKRAGGKLASDS